ncbi:MAG: saccharopine dehydrogenase NADP-binding domain-containing protein [Cohaesibacter sp.]|jgi:saccharopine dehydrogenase (NADP+, L-glutamate forming)|nr:saccharopine dehydrogenase NADP-binding domain-containing protein [Cohaesibacter sp.]
MAHIHWLGAGLASVPGIRRLIKSGREISIWERDLEKANEAVSGLEGRFVVKEALDGALEADLKAGDIVVSMLPASFHPTIAELCLKAKTHFVSSSYISPQMEALNRAAQKEGLVFINEVGLDPGIDHLFAHLLMDDYKNSPVFDKTNDHDFRSYCGGFPAVANAFKYKFSWSPLGVLKALSSPAKAIKGGKIVDVARPWDAVEDYQVAFTTGTETFQSYPNRDSLPFMAEYGFEEDWAISQFVRGTLRLDGWAQAWSDVFDAVKNWANPEGEAELAQLSDRLWADHAYQPHEADRVVLSVELKVMRGGETIWHKSKVLNSYGNEEDSAMGRLVSIPVSLATEAVLEGKLKPGVQPAPCSVGLIHHWLDEIALHEDVVQHLDLLEDHLPVAAE